MLLYKQISASKLQMQKSQMEITFSMTWYTCFATKVLYYEMHGDKALWEKPNEN